MKSSLARRFVPAALVLALFAAACSSGSNESVIEAQIESRDGTETDSGSEPASTTPREGGDASEAPPASDGLVLPSVEVDKVSGGKVDLASFADGTKPIVVWAWAPH